MDIYQLLDTHGITYQQVDHTPVFTCEEADQLVPKLPGAKTKNLFLRNKKGNRHFLLTARSDKRVDLKKLSSALKCGGLSVASAERLQEHLNLKPGAVSLLALINDKKQVVEVLLDENLQREQALLCLHRHETIEKAYPKRRSDSRGDEGSGCRMENSRHPP